MEMVAFVPRFRMHNGFSVSQPETVIFVYLPAFEPGRERVVNERETKHLNPTNQAQPSMDSQFAFVARNDEKRPHTLLLSGQPKIIGDNCMHNAAQRTHTMNQPAHEITQYTIAESIIIYNTREASVSVLVCIVISVISQNVNGHYIWNTLLWRVLYDKGDDILICI